MSDDRVTIELDGTSYEARKGAMIIEVADEAGVRIPRFCYHKKLKVAANCRMCLVEVAKAPKPLPACATPVADGMKVATRSPLALDAQKSVMEFLLINHPLDCPICDQGGECELQDVAMGYGRDVSRFNERKRVVPDKDLGPLIATDMTRCIHCTRCVRFGEEIGGMPEMGATGRGEHMKIGTFVERALASEMSGNMIDVCPVGALTSKPFRFRARAWEMTQFDSVAPHDGVGSNLHLHVARERVMRVVPRENEDINEVWLSDRDRFSYEGLYHDDRLMSPMVKLEGRWREVDWDTALNAAAEGLAGSIARHGAERLGALASPSATLEELYLVQKLVRGLGCSNIDHRLRQVDFRHQASAPLMPSLGLELAALENADAVLLVGANVRKEHPIVNHRIHKAALAGAQVMMIDSVDRDLNFHLAAKRVVSPARLVGCLGGLANACNAPDVAQLCHAAEASDALKEIAEHLAQATEGAILLGPSALNHPHAALIDTLARAIGDAVGAHVGCLGEGANAAGAWLTGAVPHRGPGGIACAPVGLTGAQMIEADLRAFLLLGVEPELDCAHSRRALDAMRGAECVVSLSAFRSEHMLSYADVLLPIAPFAETSGTYVNLQGLWQSFEGAVPPPGDGRPAWKILRVLGNIFELPGFAYVDSASIRDEVRALGAPGETTVGEGLSEFEAPSISDDELWRLGDVPIYATDALVRRASALQATPDGRISAARLNASVAKRFGIVAGQEVIVGQEGVEASMTVELDERVADGCVQIPAATPLSVGLGAAFGPVALRAR